MNSAFYISGIGLNSQQNALDTIANNIANINTSGFKRSSVKFSEIFTTTSELAFNENVNSNTDFHGVRSLIMDHIMQQGNVEYTNNPMDIAIEGEGFIELISPSGEMILWRGGYLRLDEEGFLIAENGMPLKAMLSVPLEATELEIHENGQVFVAMQNGDEREEIGEIRLVRVSEQNSLERLNNGFYRVLDAAHIFDVKAMDDGGGHLIQGALERSNVDLNREMIDMMIVQRAYSANAQVVQAADQIMSIVNTLRR